MYSNTKPKTDRWYSADGRDTFIRQMESRHIRNCIKLILDQYHRGRLWRFRFLKPLRDELRRRARGKAVG